MVQGGGRPGRRPGPACYSVAELYLESRHHSLERELRLKSLLLNRPALPLSVGSEQSQLRRKSHPVASSLPHGGNKPFPSEEAYLP